MKIPSLYPMFLIRMFSLHSDVNKEYFKFTPLHPIIHFIRARYILVASRVRLYSVHSQDVPQWPRYIAAPYKGSAAHREKHKSCNTLATVSRTTLFRLTGVHHSRDNQRCVSEMPNQRLSLSTAILSQCACRSVTRPGRLALNSSRVARLLDGSMVTTDGFERRRNMFEELHCSPQDGVS